MFGSIGGIELLVILLLGLLVFGPRRLPELGRSLGRSLAEFRRATQDLKESIEREVDLKDADLRRDLRDLDPRPAIAAALDPSLPSPAETASSPSGSSPSPSPAPQAPPSPPAAQD